MSSWICILIICLGNIFIFHCISRRSRAWIKSWHIDIFCWFLLAAICVSNWSYLSWFCHSIWMIVRSSPSNSVHIIFYIEILLRCYMKKCFLHQRWGWLIDSRFLLDSTRFFRIIWLIKYITLSNYIIFKTAFLVIIFNKSILKWYL